MTKLSDERNGWFSVGSLTGAKSKAKESFGVEEVCAMANTAATASQWADSVSAGTPGHGRLAAQRLAWQSHCRQITLAWSSTGLQVRQALA